MNRRGSKKSKIENPEMPERQIEREVMLLSELDVEKEAVERSILIYQVR